MSRNLLILIFFFSGCSSQYNATTCYSPGYVPVTLKISIVHIVNHYYRHDLTICGVVSDSSDDTPINGINVLLLKSDMGTVTDSSGRFCLDRIRNSDSLSFSLVGFRRKVLSSSKIFDAINMTSRKIVAF
jgi:hypothetical protein